jgi:diadenosine tetraphosphate (Ap4A) HIT family hydrolase
MANVMKDCIFCKIVKGEAPAYKVWEDEKYVAILDIYPNIRGQTLVIQKRHDESYVFALPDATIVKFIKATKTVANMLEKKLKVKRVHMIFEGTGVNHFHAKLYPAIGYAESSEPLGVKPVRFDRYPGYVTSAGGLEASEEELKAIQKEITS